MRREFAVPEGMPDVRIGINGKAIDVSAIGGQQRKNNVVVVPVDALCDAIDGEFPVLLRSYFAHVEKCLGRVNATFNDGVPSFFHDKALEDELRKDSALLAYVCQHQDLARRLTGTIDHAIQAAMTE
jgi:hypothetical protein